MEFVHNVQMHSIHWKIEINAHKIVNIQIDFELTFFLKRILPKFVLLYRISTFSTAFFVGFL